MCVFLALDARYDILIAFSEQRTKYKTFLNGGTPCAKIFGMRTIHVLREKHGYCLDLDLGHSVSPSSCTFKLLGNSVDLLERGGGGASAGKNRYKFDACYDRSIQVYRFLANKNLTDGAP